MIYQLGKRYYYGVVYGRRLRWWMVPFIKYFARKRGLSFRKDYFL